MAPSTRTKTNNHIGIQDTKTNNHVRIRSLTTCFSVIKHHLLNNCCLCSGGTTTDRLRRPWRTSTGRGYRCLRIQGLISSPSRRSQASWRHRYVLSHWFSFLLWMYKLSSFLCWSITCWSTGVRGCCIKCRLTLSFWRRMTQGSPLGFLSPPRMEQTRRAETLSRSALP